MPGNLTFDEIARSSRPVGIECGHCYRRVLVDPKAGLRARKGDRRTLSEGGVRCGRCGSRGFTVTVFQTEGKAAAFLRNH
jgi:hypothetical protein